MWPLLEPSLKLGVLWPSCLLPEWPLTTWHQAMPPFSADTDCGSGVSFMLIWPARTHLLATTCVPEVPSQVAPPMRSTFLGQDMSYSAQEKKMATRPWELSREMHATWVQLWALHTATDNHRSKLQESKSLPLHPFLHQINGAKTVRYTVYMLRLRCVYCLG